MSYQTTFRLKEELDNQFKPFITESDKQFKPFTTEISKSNLEKYFAILEGTCLLPNKGKLDYYTLCTIYDNLYLAVKIMVSEIVEIWRLQLKERFNDKNEVSFCGWEYSDDQLGSLWKDEEEVVGHYTRTLFLHSIVPTKGKYDTDNQDYQEKAQTILDIICEIEESVYTTMDYKFISFYRNSDKADESDGCNHKFPEEIKD